MAYCDILIGACKLTASVFLFQLCDAGKGFNFEKSWLRSENLYKSIHTHFYHKIQASSMLPRLDVHLIRFVE